MAVESNPPKIQFLCVADSFISILIFVPLVVAAWRGLWQLMDCYLYKENPVASLWASTAIGVGLNLFFDLFQIGIQKTLCYQRTPKTFIIISRIYTVAYCLASVNHWRGIWNAWDVYTGRNWLSTVGSTILGLFVLSILKGVRNLIAPPFIVLPDHYNGYFTVQNLYGTSKYADKYFFIDVFTSVVMIMSLVVFAWRGVWVFLDIFLFPDNQLYSAFGSLIIGLVVTIITFLCHPIIGSMEIFKTKGIRKIIVEDIYYIFCFFGCLNLWRGYWVLLNVLLYPDRPVLSNWISTVIGIVVLMIMQSANSIFVRGIQMDGSKEGAMGLRLSTDYLRFFLKKEKQEIPEEEKFFKNDENKQNDIKLKSNGLINTRNLKGDPSFQVTIDAENEAQL